MVLLTGCNGALVKLDSSLISADKATLIVYSDESYNKHYIFMDNESIGLAHREIPLKVEVSSGKHILYRREADSSDSLTLGLTSQKTRVNFEAGKVYFMKVRLKSYFLLHATMKLVPVKIVEGYYPL